MGVIFSQHTPHVRRPDLCLFFFNLEILHCSNTRAYLSLVNKQSGTVLHGHQHCLQTLQLLSERLTLISATDPNARMEVKKELVKSTAFIVSLNDLVFFKLTVLYMNPI